MKNPGSEDLALSRPLGGLLASFVNSENLLE